MVLRGTRRQEKGRKDLAKKIGGGKDYGKVEGIEGLRYVTCINVMRRRIKMKIRRKERSK
jgi:hypothetical protein